MGALNREDHRWMSDRMARLLPEPDFTYAVFAASDSIVTVEVVHRVHGPLSSGGHIVTDPRAAANTAFTHILMLVQSLYEHNEHIEAKLVKRLAKERDDKAAEECKTPEGEAGVE